MSKITLTALAQTLPSTVPFVGPETQERALGKKFKARLGANESLFGPSPKAILAMEQAAADIWQYGDPENYDLRNALAQHHDIDPAHIIIGEGIDGLLSYLVRLLVDPGTPIVTSHGAYPTFNFHAVGYGGILHTVPYKNDHEDPQALITKVSEVGAKLVYFANPDNPMGTWHTANTVQGLMDNIPQEALLVLDEAYVEMAPKGTAPPLNPETENVIRMRTFSKAYGMAGARVGYAIGPKELIKSFDKVRNHFGVSRISQIGALAALGDLEHLENVQKKVRDSRNRLHQIARENGLSTLPSAANFVSIDCGKNGNFARKVLENLVANSVFIRMSTIAPMDRCIRVSCGDTEAIHTFEKALPIALQAAASS
ncbi:MAG: pyridoxal phosphate-dependent aminotransferase, partial [Planktomarina sp.]|nr:pyridoxal phosphate-dependent aminotransferase [Planktomarina sp.]